LQQGTEYKYQLSNDGTNWGKAYDYKTLPSTDIFTFAAVSDVQIANTAHRDTWITVAEKLKKAGANFIVHTGDQVDATTTLNIEYGYFFEPEELRSIPLAPLMGNHDSHCEFWYRYNLPNEDRPTTPCEATGSYAMSAGDKGSDRFEAGNYYYRYNNILFIGLNTAYYPNSRDDASDFITKYESTIKSAKAANEGKYDFINDRKWRNSRLHDR